MARIADIEEQDHPELAPLIARIKAERGKLLDLYKILLHSPAVMEGWLGFFTAIRQKTKLAGRYRELASLPVALKAGPVAPLFDAAERAVLAYTDTMTKQIQVPDELFAEVQKHFDAQDLVELTATIAGYNLVSRFLEAMQVHRQS